MENDLDPRPKVLGWWEFQLVPPANLLVDVRRYNSVVLCDQTVFRGNSHWLPSPLMRIATAWGFQSSGREATFRVVPSAKTSVIEPSVRVITPNDVALRAHSPRNLPSVKVWPGRHVNRLATYVRKRMRSIGPTERRTTVRNTSSLSLHEHLEKIRYILGCTTRIAKRPNARGTSRSTFHSPATSSTRPVISCLTTLLKENLLTFQGFLPICLAWCFHLLTRLSEVLTAVNTYPIKEGLDA